jgi:hypothetical protein
MPPTCSADFSVSRYIHPRPNSSKKIPFGSSGGSLGSSLHFLGQNHNEPRATSFTRHLLPIKTPFRSLTVVELTNLPEKGKRKEKGKRGKKDRYYLPLRKGGIKLDRLPDFCIWPTPPRQSNLTGWMMAMNNACSFFVPDSIDPEKMLSQQLGLLFRVFPNDDDIIGLSNFQKPCRVPQLHCPRQKI